MLKNIQLSATIPSELDKVRLDKALVQLFPEHSRSRFQEWIKTDQVKVDGKPLRAKDPVREGQIITIDAGIPPPVPWQAEDEQLVLIYEDDALMVINKPAGQVVHPATAHTQGTLVGAILHHAPACAHLPRAGIIHRLDKDTTGLLVVPKTLTAHTSLVQQLQKREMKREYLALVRGIVIAGGTISAAMGRHPTARMKMAVVEDGKTAVTHYRVEKKFAQFTLLRVQLETGRTHQIRVHMAHIHHPIIGDQTYAGRQHTPAGLTLEQREMLQQFKRQALHAQRLTFIHPVSGESMSFTAPLPEDFNELLKHL